MPPKKGSKKVSKEKPSPSKAETEKIDTLNQETVFPSLQTGTGGLALSQTAHSPNKPTTAELKAPENKEEQKSSGRKTKVGSRKAKGKKNENKADPNINQANISQNGEKHSGKKASFNPLWLDASSSKYRPWAKETGKTGRIFCVWCSKELSIDSLYGTSGHLKTEEHLEHQNKWIAECGQSVQASETILELDKTKMFEVDLCKLLIQLNLPFSTVEPILEFVKNYSHAHFIQKSTLNRHKAPTLIKKEIENLCIEKIKENLCKQYFSFIVDEVTDISKKKYLAIMIQYLDDKEGPVCKLLSLTECSISSTAESLVDIIEKEVLSQQFSQNLIGLVSDGAKVMNGIHNSVLAKLLKFNPSLWYLHCICHCLHLVASKASEKIPKYVIKFVKKVYKYFSKSPKRIAQFEAVVQKMDYKIKKILRAGKTRWLSLEAAIKRILELWEPLKSYFKEIGDDNSYSKSFDDNLLHVYLEFLSVFLEKINAINLYFQKEVSELLYVKSKLFKIYVNFTNHIFKPFVQIGENIQELDPISRFNIDLETNIKNYLMTTDEIYQHFVSVFGQIIHLNSLEESKRFKVCKDFQEFILEVLIQLRKYMPFNDLVLSKISTLDPDMSIAQDWLELVKYFPNIIKSQEFHSFYDEVSDWIMDIKDLKLKKQLYIEDKGFNVINFYRDPLISTNFPMICRLAKALLSLPHSSAAVERVFSKLKLIKNERRNCLHNDTLQSLLIIKVNEIDISKKKENLNGLLKDIKSAGLKRKISLISNGISKEDTNSLKKEPDNVKLNEQDSKFIHLNHTINFIDKRIKLETEMNCVLNEKYLIDLEQLDNNDSESINLILNILFSSWE